MYFWKCWRETRLSFYVSVTLGALLWKIMDFTMSVGAGTLLADSFAIADRHVPSRNERIGVASRTRLGLATPWAVSWLVVSGAVMSARCGTRA